LKRHTVIALSAFDIIVSFFHNNDFFLYRYFRTGQAIEKNQNNFFVNLFFARILTIKGGIIAYKRLYATKEWYDSAIENQLNDYNELCFFN
ncbi:hypothetical protein OBK12_13510, partial [Empedobacter falsenii]